MIEVAAIKLFILCTSIPLATPAQQLAAWNAQPAQMQQAYRQKAKFLQE